MGRLPSGLDDYLEWQERLDSFDSSGLDIESFCEKEGVSRSTYYRWLDKLKDGIPKAIEEESVVGRRPDSAEGASFVPIALQASPIVIELPNGGVVKLPLSVGPILLMEAIRAAGTMRPAGRMKP
jgi:hypothetical protein